MNTKTLIILSIYITTVYGRLPAFLRGKKCPRSDPELVPCLLKGIESVRPRLKNGIHEINFPRLEPFRLRELELDADVTGMKVKGEATNIVAKGPSEFKIKKLKVDLDKYEVELTINFPHLSVTADYDTMGSTILNMDVNGSGQFKGEFTDVTATGKAKGHAKKQKGFEYVKIDTISVSIDLGKNPKIKLEPDDKTATATFTARLLENNVGVLLENATPVINSAAVPLIIKHANKVLNVVPLNDIIKMKS